MLVKAACSVYAKIRLGGYLMLASLSYGLTKLDVANDTNMAFAKQGMQICLDACAKLATIMRECLKGPDSALEE